MLRAKLQWVPTAEACFCFCLAHEGNRKIATLPKWACPLKLAEKHLSGCLSFRRYSFTPLGGERQCGTRHSNPNRSASTGPLSPEFDAIFHFHKILKAEFLKTDCLISLQLVWYDIHNRLEIFYLSNFFTKTSIFNFLTDDGEVQVDELKSWKMTWKFCFLSRTWLIWKIQGKIKFTRTSNI